MPPTLRREARRVPGRATASDGRELAAAKERVGLTERLERARAPRGREARDASRAEELERLRRKGFEESPLLRGHEDELLAITGELARVLPTRTEYRLHTGEEWGDAAALGSEALARRAVIENPSQTFVWEVRHNPSGMLAASSNREYKWALENTDAISDLWEGGAVASEAELAKALIVQTVLGDDGLRSEVLRRAGSLARTAAGTLGPYFADWKR